jgi:chromosomal replication initiation ATPase DnaA
MSKKFKHIDDVIAMQKKIISIKGELDNMLTVLDKILSENTVKHDVSLAYIFNASCEAHNIDPAKALSDSRKRYHAQCRVIYAQIAVEYCNYDITEVMNYINRDRSTYYNSKEKHENFMSYLDEYKDVYNLVLQKIQKYQDEKKGES